jgi:hypothetical protein
MTGNVETTYENVNEQGSSSQVKDLSRYVPEKRRKPGEIGFSVICFMLGALGYYFALGMTSGQFSSPSVFPKLASALIMVFSAVNFWKASKKEKPAETDPGLLEYLLPVDVTVIILLLVGYCVFLPRLHFIASSYAFMVIAMIYLHRGKKILQALLFSAIALAVLVGVFRYLFLVILP